MKMLGVVVWVKVDANGDYAVGADAETCTEVFAGDVGETAGVATRLVRVVLSVPAPVVPTLTGVVPAEGGATLAVA